MCFSSIVERQPSGHTTQLERAHDEADVKGNSPAHSS